MNNKPVKFISALLAGLMIFSLLPFSAFHEFIERKADDEESEYLLSEIIEGSDEAQEISSGLSALSEDITVEPGEIFDMALSADISAESPVTAFAVSLSISDNDMLTVSGRVLPAAGYYGGSRSYDNSWLFYCEDSRDSLSGDAAFLTLCAAKEEGDVTVDCTLIATHEDSSFSSASCSFTVHITEAVHISTAEQLAAITSFDGYFKLDCDIDLADYSDDGRHDIICSGTIDGCGHTVAGLGGPFIETNTGAIRNLTVYSLPSVDAPVCVYNTGLIENCVNLSDISVEDSFAAGGICAINSGTIIRCVNYGDIEVSAYSFAIIGGIAGESIDGTISRCANYGDILLTVSDYETGETEEDEGGELFPEVDILCCAGGITGNSVRSTISDAADYGEVSAGGAEQIGGSDCVYGVGGIVGSCTDSSLINTFSTSEAGTTNRIADNEGTTALVNCYYICEEQNANGIFGTALTEAEASDSDSFDGFAFFFTPDVEYRWKMDGVPALTDIPAVTGYSDSHLGTRTVYRGRYAPVTLTLDRPLSSTGLLISVSCDSDYIILSPEDIEINGSCVSDVEMLYDNIDGSVTAIFDEEYSLEGEIVTIPVWVASDAPNGSYGVSVRILSCDSDYNYSVLSTVDSDIRVVDYVYGDVNDDCLFNTSDAVALLFYYTGLRHFTLPTEFIAAGADVNRDGRTNSTDAVWLLWNIFWPEQYPINWNTVAEE